MGRDLVRNQPGMAGGTEPSAGHRVAAGVFAGNSEAKVAVPGTPGYLRNGGRFPRQEGALQVRGFTRVSGIRSTIGPGVSVKGRPASCRRDFTRAAFPGACVEGQDLP